MRSFSNQTHTVMVTQERIVQALTGIAKRLRSDSREAQQLLRTRGGTSETSKFAETFPQLPGQPLDSFSDEELIEMGIDPATVKR